MKTINIVALSLALAAGAFAQAGKRTENQQDRIAEGVKSGQLTAGETSKLEREEARIHREAKADRAKNGGKLTPAEKKAINRQQNAVSDQIYKDKHNAAAQHYGNNEVDARRADQQQRIANGIASGTLKPGETARLESKEAGINHEVKAERAANGGKLTPAERRTVNKQQNAVSNQIYKDKH